MAATESIWLKNLVLTEVTAADPQAVTIHKTPYMGADEGWAEIETGFDYNGITSLTVTYAKDTYPPDMQRF